jgi:hypothetical protein
VFEKCDLRKKIFLFEHPFLRNGEMLLEPIISDKKSV